MKTKLQTAVVVVCAVAFPAVVQTQAEENHWKALTDLKFPGDYPTKASSQLLFDELDFQRAVQVYLWAPLLRLNVGLTDVDFNPSVVTDE